MAKLSISLCSIEGCTSRVTGKGLCNRHYRRMRRHGDPNGGQPTCRGAPMRFAEEAARSDTDECILWPFSLSNGYGSIYVEGRNQPAHRFVLTKAFGPPASAALVAAHAPVVCHNRSCVNPRHLRWASEAQNASDRMLDGTENIGERQGQSRLTVADVLAIRGDDRVHDIIAKEYGVSRETVSGAKRRATWAWLGDGPE